MVEMVMARGSRSCEVFGYVRGFFVGLDQLTNTESGFLWKHVKRCVRWSDIEWRRSRTEKRHLSRQLQAE
jgi:hypothetical protein